MQKIGLKDYEEIIKVVSLYTEGGNKSSEIMKPAFHKNATINGEPIQTLFDVIDEKGETNSRARIDVLDVINDIAVVRITMEGWHGQDFVDLHLLHKGADGWKIVAKVFTGLE